jgi:hypothetical protein
MDIGRIHRGISKLLSIRRLRIRSELHSGTPQPGENFLPSTHREARMEHPNVSQGEDGLDLYRSAIWKCDSLGTQRGRNDREEPIPADLDLTMVDRE